MMLLIKKKTDLDYEQLIRIVFHSLETKITWQHKRDMEKLVMIDKK